MIIDGKKVSEDWLMDLKSTLANMDTKPSLGILLVGDNVSSKKFIEKKLKTASELGLVAQLYQVGEKVKQSAIQSLMALIVKSHDGVIVQLPLPKNIDAQKILDMVPADKDVDGLATESEVSTQKFMPATVRGILYLLEILKINISDNSFAVVGQGKLVGRPLSEYLKSKGAKVFQLNINSGDYKRTTKVADVVIVAIGRAKLLDSTYFREGQIVIDAGFNFIDGKLYGDVDTNEVKNVVAQITPVPGGVGPLTVAGLMANLIETKLEKK